eukprot:277493-Pyramimonas_sp.AAC.2
MVRADVPGGEPGQARGSWPNRAAPHFGVAGAPGGGALTGNGDVKGARDPLHHHVHGAAAAA